MNGELSRERREMEVSYRRPNVEKEISDGKGKTVKSAKIIHRGPEGFLTIEFTDGTVKQYCYNDLVFWEQIEIR